MKFKVGDSIRLQSDSHYLHNGTQGIIKSIKQGGRDPYVYQVYMETEHNTWLSEDEMIPSKEDIVIKLLNKLDQCD